MRILAINDISCIGKCSLTVALPIISACGVTCDVLPTALLSTHTGEFKGYTFLDLSSEIPSILNHWQKLNIKFDIIYSGYLGNISQIELVKSIKTSFLKNNGIFVVDPVMGDNGKLYDHFDLEFVKEMLSLSNQADYILPNLTEACLLTNTPYNTNITLNEIEKIIFKLHNIKTTPIITGVKEENNNKTFYISNDKLQFNTQKHIEGFFHGSGDVFASAFTGCLARGKNVDEAVTLSAQLTTNSIIRTYKYKSDPKFGLYFEEELPSFISKLNS